MLRVGLTGGIGSGKSAVATLLAAHGAFVIDADAIARELVSPGGPVLPLLVAEFGPEILRADGALDRAGLAALVFNDGEQLARLNAIMHPRIAERTAELVARAPRGSIVVYDMPLLVENRLTEDWAAIVVVDAPDELRRERVVTEGRLTTEDMNERMAAQVSREERLARADYVIDNSGTIADLSAAVDRLWADLSERQTPGP